MDRGQSALSQHLAQRDWIFCSAMVDWGEHGLSQTRWRLVTTRGFDPVDREAAFVSPLRRQVVMWFDDCLTRLPRVVEIPNDDRPVRSNPS